jgi:hypothetical protein
MKDHVAIGILLSLQQIDLISLREFALHSPVMERGSTRMKFLRKKILFELGVYSFVMNVMKFAKRLRCLLLMDLIIEDP